MGSRHRTSRYNQPEKVSSRYRRGDRRWSFYLTKERPNFRKETPQFWTIAVEEITYGGGYGGTLEIKRFYSCDCPDFQRTTTATPGFDVPPAEFSRIGTPRVFGVEATKHYLSNYLRYEKGLLNFHKIQEYEEIGTITYYRYPTTRREKYTRDFSTSSAGIYPGWCKHIWAVVIYRGDPYQVPDDVPDVFLGKEIELPSEWDGISMW